MLVHVDDLIPGMELDSDVRLRAGSFLITRRELPTGCLDDGVIEAIRKFSAQLAPEPHLVEVKSNEIALRHLGKVLETQVARIARAVEEGRDHPCFIRADELREKIMRVMEKIVSNPDIITNLYSFQLNRTRTPGKIDRIMEHSIRVALLTIALGLRMRLSIVSLVNLGMAAALHDVGMLRTRFWPDLEKLDEMGSMDLEEFVVEHQEQSARIVAEQPFNLLPHTRAEIGSLIASHHRIDIESPSSKTGVIFYLANLVDEMISQMPYRARFNFTPVQLHLTGERLKGRTGLLNVMMALVKLTRGKGFAWEAVSALADIFSLDSVLVENYEEKLRSIIDGCPFRTAVAYPPLSGNSLPRSVYCSGSRDQGFSCENLGQARIEIITPGGQIKSHLKCSSLTDSLHELNKSSRN